MNIRWIEKEFDQLTLNELYEVMSLRQKVFIIEQHCNYHDADGKDLRSSHLMGFASEKLVAYARIVAPGVSYAEVSIGRILSSKEVRGTGVGKQLMDEALRRIEQHYGKVAVRISAQRYLKRFYQDFKFQPTGKEYLEDEIPHMEMLRPASI